MINFVGVVLVSGGPIVAAKHRILGQVAATCIVRKRIVDPIDRCHEINEVIEVEHLTISSNSERFISGGIAVLTIDSLNKFSPL